MTNWFSGVATLIASVFAAMITVRLSRKGPHDRLEQLAKIHTELGKLDEDGVIEIAIRRELRRLNTLNAAREEGFLTYVRTYLRQQGTAERIVGFATALIVFSFFGWLVVAPNWHPDVWAGILLGAGALFVLAGIVSTIYLLKTGEIRVRTGPPMSKHQRARAIREQWARREARTASPSPQSAPPEP